LAVVVVSLLLASTTACSGGTSSPQAGAASATTNSSSAPTTAPSAGSSTGSTAASDKSAVPLPQISATQVVAGLTSAGYKCSRDSTYATCTSGPVAVWVLTGEHKRPPVVSLHSQGPIGAATAAIAKDLPQALEVAHVNERAQIVSWFGQQAGRTSATSTFGDWQVELSAEVDTDEPGAHLTLMDKLCKTNCQAE
jgi:hypothetical protein